MMRPRLLVIASLLFSGSCGLLTSCAQVKPAGTLAQVMGVKETGSQPVDDVRHIKPTESSGQLRWKVDF